MPGLHPEVLLLVAGHIDLQTLSSLSQTSSFTNNLINTYEQSIVKAMVDRRIAAGLVFPPCCYILASATHKRKILRPFSFFVIQELDMRSRRVEALFSPGSPLVTAIHGSQSFAALPDRELDNLIAGLKRAVMLADRISDCAAEALLEWVEPGEPLPMWPPKDVSNISPPLLLHGYYEARRIRRTVKLAQLEVLHSFSPTDLTFLSTLADIAGMAYPGPVWTPGVKAAFMETIYSHGNMALWARLGPCYKSAAPATGGSGSDKPDQAVHVSGCPGGGSTRGQFIGTIETALCEVLIEMGLWEAGQGAYKDDQFADESLFLPGIYLRIRTVYSRKTGRPFERVGVDMNVAVLLAIREGLVEEG